MRLFGLLTMVCGLLAIPSGCQQTWADEQAAANNNAAADRAADKDNEPEKILPPEKVQTPKKLVREPRAPLRAMPLLSPQDLFMPVSPYISKTALKKTGVEKKQAEQKLVEQKRAVRPLVRRPNPPLRSPRQERLSPAATYQLESMGRHVHLSPAMRFHLNRPSTRRAVTAGNHSPAARSSSASAANASGQGAQKFYPAVRRLPTQKPFANLERPPTAVERYWPLLLEGRQDPNTGLIIWSLP